MASSHRAPSLAIHPMTEGFEEAIATVTAKEHYSFGPGGLIGSGDLCSRECRFEGLASAKTRWLLPNTVSAARYDDTRKTMAHNNLHYLAAATMFAGRLAEGCRAHEFLR